MDEWIDGFMSRWIDGWIDIWLNELFDIQTWPKASSLSQSSSS